MRAAYLVPDEKGWPGACNLAPTSSCSQPATLVKCYHLDPAYITAALVALDRIPSPIRHITQVHHSSQPARPPPIASGSPSLHPYQPTPPPNRRAHRNAKPTMVNLGTRFVDSFRREIPAHGYEPKGPAIGQKSPSEGAVIDEKSSDSNADYGNPNYANVQAVHITPDGGAILTSDESGLKRNLSGRHMQSE